MKRHLILFFISLLPLLAMSQGVITRSVKKPQPQKQAGISKPTGSINGHGYVDLGLSVKWATCNVGASSPSEYGGYYAWGEITTYTENTRTNYKTYMKDIDNIEGNPQYDVARAKWGGSWRLPTKAECEELRDKCTWKWSTQGGHKGCIVTSKINGKSIFLPTAGERFDTQLNYVGMQGRYWSSTLNKDENFVAYNLYFHNIPSEKKYDVSWSSLNTGFSIRPVTE